MKYYVEGVVTLFLLVFFAGMAVADGYQSAIAAFRQGRFQEALSALAALPKTEADRPAAQNLRGLALLELRRYEEALAANELARKLDPHNPNYYYNAGLIWLAKGDSRSAEQFFVQAIGLFPQSSRLQEGLGETLFRINRFKEAEQALRRAIELDASSATAHAALAKLYYALGDGKNLALAATRAIQLDARNYVACYYYGKYLMEYRENFAEGARYIRESAELSPAFVDAWITLGGILSRQGQWNEAADAYERAVERDPANVQSWYLLSVAYRKSGKNEKAEKALNEFKKYRKP